MGNWVKRIWRIILVVHYHKGVGGCWFHCGIHQYLRLGGRRASLVEYPHRRIVQQAGWWSRYSTPLSRRGRDWVHDAFWFPYDKQWGGVRGISGRTGSRPSSRGLKYGCLLWLLGGHKLGEWWLQMQRWTDKEILRASKEMGGRPSGQVCLNPKRREQASWSSCQSRISRTHAHP